MPNTTGWTKNLGRETITKILDFLGNDGHTIYATDQILELGVPTDILNSVMERHVTERRNPKSQLFNAEGIPVNQIDGVYGLALLKKIAADLGIFSAKLGRGWQMRDLQEQVRAAVDKW